MQRADSMEATLPTFSSTARDSGGNLGVKAGEIDRLRKAIAGFQSWLDRNGPLSYDPYDLWGTSPGLKARSLYYGQHPVAIFAVAPFLLAEIFFPSSRKAFV